MAIRVRIVIGAVCLAAVAGGVVLLRTLLPMSEADPARGTADIDPPMAVTGEPGTPTPDSPNPSVVATDCESGTRRWTNRPGASNLEPVVVTTGADSYSVRWTWADEAQDEACYVVAVTYEGKTHRALLPAGATTYDDPSPYAVDRPVIARVFAVWPGRRTVAAAVRYTLVPGASVPLACVSAPGNAPLPAPLNLMFDARRQSFAWDDVASGEECYIVRQAGGRMPGEFTPDAATPITDHLLPPETEHFNLRLDFEPCGEVLELSVVTATAIGNRSPAALGSTDPLVCAD